MLPVRHWLTSPAYLRRIPQLARDEAFAEAQEWSVSMFRAEEGAEGMAAFREKRKTSWIKE